MSPRPGASRHISIRVPGELYEGLEALAATNGETVSQCARRLLADGVTPRRGPAATIDQAIAGLQQLRRFHAAEPASAGPRSAIPESPTAPETRTPVHEVPARAVNVLNAKANLSRLLADVARGEEIVIVHAGSSRARLVPAED